MVSKRMKVGTWGSTRMVLILAAAAVVGLVQAVPARAGLVYTGTTNSAISFGASGYVPGNGIPQWIGNNVTGLNDILSSPGGTFGAASPVMGNNVASVGAAAYGPGTTQFLDLTGGNAPASGAPFGSGAATIYGPVATFALTDATLGGGGTASYGIETWTSNFVQTTPFVGTFGTFLSIAGNVGIVGSSAIAALQSEVTVNGVTTVFAPEILAIGNLGGGTYTYAYNSASGANISVNALTGAFSGLAIDSYAANLLAGSNISVTSTLTFYADPASIDSSTPDLTLIPGGALPGEILFGSAVPEPSTAVMGGAALVVLSAVGWLRRRRSRRRVS